MATRYEPAEILDRLKTYLDQTLLPFWLDNAPDPEFGGFLTYFDSTGQPTGETVKTFLMQIRMLYTLSSTHRMGYGAGRCAEQAVSGARFITQYYWDDLHDGWYWIADRSGQPKVKDKIGYGQCFAIYAFSEYALATGDPLGKAFALRTYDAVSRHMTDTRHGGYLELFTRDWQPFPPGASGGDRKSFDVHMHMMEALTSLYALTGSNTHRRRLREIIDLILARMLHPTHGVGYSQFSLDFTPLPRILFETEWGRDSQPSTGAAPLDQTSPGHNIEFAWLLVKAAEILDIPKAAYAEILRTQCDHCIELGIDHEYGGVYADVPMASHTKLTEKQFWQQAEALVGFLDAYLLLGDQKYWQAFLNVLNFVFEKLVVMDAGGEWYERVDRYGSPIDNALGHAWKINYHTVRAMVQCIERLKVIAGQTA